MAILKGPFKLEGKVGNLVFSSSNGKTICREKPQFRPENMTAATKESAGEFGEASKAGKLIRNTLATLWPVPKDGSLVNRLTTQLASALRMDERPRGQRTFSTQAIQQVLRDFRFNSKAVPHMLAGTVQEPDGSIIVSLPENWPLYLKWPRYAPYVQLQVAALAVDLANGVCQQVATTTDYLTADTPHNGKFPGLQLPPGPATVILVVLQARFFNKETNGQFYASHQKNCMLSYVTAVLAPLPPAPAPKPRRAKKASSRKRAPKNA